MIGVLVRFHDSLGQIQEMHSDSVYLVVHGHVQMVPISDLEQLNDSNTFRHGIYATLLQSLSNQLTFNREYIIRWMKEDYSRGVIRLQELIAKKGTDADAQRIRALVKTLMNITDTEIEKPLVEAERNRKDEVKEQLRKEAVGFGGMAFVHLCALAETKEDSGEK